ncbi:uncharacterized protein LOC143022047 [Oratosquilla oratoria]|uniref:uncharacterized protein LOC143022047 n=1 Tax=Oratosquilla oratoria TaxID=337810 RepID=UPI003F767DBB
MGSPILAEILVEITMQCFEEEILVAAPTSLILWVWYPDDVFAVLKEGELDGFLAQLNSKNKNIQFEMEKEVEGKLPFLDALVTHNGHSLSTSVSRKSMHTDRLLDYESNHPACHKRSVVKTVTILYVKGASEITARLLRRHSVNAAHKSCNTLHGALTKVKDREFKKDQARAVYEVKFKDCNVHYVGETGKKLSTRLQEHRRAMNRRDQSSAIFRHCDEHQNENTDITRFEVRELFKISQSARQSFH